MIRKKIKLGGQKPAVDHSQDTGLLVNRKTPDLVTNIFAEDELDLTDLMEVFAEDVYDEPIPATATTTTTTNVNPKQKSSKYIGVSRCKKNPKWIAQYKIGGVSTYLGSFDSELEAAIWYDIKAFEQMEIGNIRLDMGRLNFGDPRLPNTQNFIKDFEANNQTIVINNHTIKIKHPKKKSTKNTSVYRGVSWYEERKCWKASIQVNRRKTYLGRFKSAEEAARAYNAKLEEYANEATDPKARNKFLNMQYEVPNIETKFPPNYHADENKDLIDIITEMNKNHESLALTPEALDHQNLDGWSFGQQNQDLLYAFPLHSSSPDLPSFVGESQDLLFAFPLHSSTPDLLGFAGDSPAFNMAPSANGSLSPRL